MKRYLHTPEEVVQALKEGKTVETDMKYYVLKDGVLNCYSKNKTGSWWSINSGIYNTDRPYVDEPEPLKLEVGKFYRTRDGRKAWVVEGTTDDTFPFRVAAQKELTVYTVTEEGKLFSEGMSGADLVAPWEEAE